MWRLTILILCLFNEINTEDPIVTIRNGKIRGLKSSTPRQNVTFYAYLGIPFAAPPIGDFRFEPPQAVENWDGIFEATSNEKICYQADEEDERETEDCLYLNVYTPNSPGERNELPVVVFIYGGTFVHGHASFGYSKPQFVLEQGVIVVTINYRVGPFGFLSTGDLIVPGNMGLKDQQFSFKWIQDNIAAFGGDPNKVTIMGQSAGGASVTYQLLSPKSKGLFRAAISNSGSALCTWAYQRHPIDTAYGIARELDPTFTRNNSTGELVGLLKKVDAKKIDNTGQTYNVFAPVMEVEHEGALFTQSMYELAEQGKLLDVPLLIGINSEEEIRRARDMDAWKKTSAQFDKDITILVDEDMYIDDKNITFDVALKIKSIYTNKTFEEDLGAGVQWYSDNRFTRGIIKFAELKSKYSEVYFYQFSYHGLLGNDSTYIEGLGRVAHAEDQRYFWAYYDSLENFPEADITTLDRYVALLTNFVKTLNPTPEPSSLLQNITWPKVTNNQFFFLDIDKELTVQENPRNFSYGKWNVLFQEYARKPFISF